MDRSQMRALVAGAPVARLATVGPAGAPHIVPFCFALDGDGVVSAVDDKPKTTTRLRRLENIRADPRVCVVVDHYSEDWTQLWWVRLDGTARVVSSGPGHSRAVELLRAKYPQYRQRPPAGPAILIAIRSWRGWSASR